MDNADISIEADAIHMIPVGLKEAALDSPTFRATFVHFVENVDALERWLESYIRSVTKLSSESNGLESLFNSFFTHTTIPLNISEAVLDHDFTILALEKYGEGAREFWTSTLRVLKKMESNIVEPIRSFMQRELRTFKDLRRQFEQSQKHLDGLQSRFSAQARTKEASFLREDAFLLYESRKVYLKASMDFSEMAPQLRVAVDKLLIRAFSDQWEDVKASCQQGLGAAKVNHDIERARGWCRELEVGEGEFRGELKAARQELEQRTLTNVAPSRELEDYSAAFASFHGGLSVRDLPNTRPEKQGWLNLRSTVGKPSRTVWTRKWFFVKRGLFGWLVPRHGAVQESEATGVLLCSVKPANAEERRFCFEIKTKDRAIFVQAETRPELIEWLGTFEFAKQKALEKPMDSIAVTASQQYAFAVVPPVASEFAAVGGDSGSNQNIEDSNSGNLDRSSTLPVPGSDIAMSLASRSSFDVATARKGNLNDRDPDSTREKIIQKLDLHRKPTIVTPQGGTHFASNSSSVSGAGGIASLISASHSVMPVGPGVLQPPDTPTFVSLEPSISELPFTSLAPLTLVNPPTATNLSTTAVVINGERGLRQGQADLGSTLPNSMLANTWGSLNRDCLNVHDACIVSTASIIEKPPLAQQNIKRENSSSENGQSGEEPSMALLPESQGGKSPSASAENRKNVTFGAFKSDLNTLNLPENYPVQLKTQSAQMTLLFPCASLADEGLLLVFQASWNAGGRRDFPGRIYVTTKSIYFYSNHIGLIFTSTLSLSSVLEITAASGRDCDFLYLHLAESTTSNATRRVTVKVFIDSFRLLQRRLMYLVEASKTSPSTDLKSHLTALIQIEREESSKAGQKASGWENASAPSDSPDLGSRSNNTNIKTNVLLEQGRYTHPQLRHDEKEITKFKLPRQPVLFEPPGMGRPVVDKEYDISPKALYHVLFGDKSVVWQLLYHERQARRIKQSSWVQPTSDSHARRDFEFEVDYIDFIGRTRHAKVIDYQMIDVSNDHLCYVVTDRKSAWYLPFHQAFHLLSKIVITHVAKSKCRLAIFTAVDWIGGPPLARGLVTRPAMNDLELDARDLADVVTDQVRKLGAHSRTKKAVQIFGQVGQQKQQSELASSGLPLVIKSRRSVERRTILGLALESTASLLEDIVTGALQVLQSIFKWSWTVIKAEHVLLLILMISIFMNTIASSKVVVNWWTERRAFNLLKTLDNQQLPVPDRAIYIRDLDVLTSINTRLSESLESKDHQW